MPTCSACWPPWPACSASPDDAARKVWRVIDAAVSAAAQSLAPEARNTRVYFEVSRGPYGAGESSFIGETLTRLGVKNIVPASLGPFPRLNPEFVVRANPDLIMMGNRSMQSMVPYPGGDTIKAVREQRVCVFGPDDSDTARRARPPHGRGRPADGPVHQRQDGPPTQARGSPAMSESAMPSAARRAAAHAGIATARQRAAWLLLGLIALSALLAGLGASVGSTGFDSVLRVADDPGRPHRVDIRLPRSLGALAGGGTAGPGGRRSAGPVSQPAGRSVFAGQCLGCIAGCGLGPGVVWRGPGHRMAGEAGAHGRCLWRAPCWPCCSRCNWRVACSTPCGCCWRG